MSRHKLQQAMRAKGYSPQAFADELRVSRCTVIAWVTGETKRIRSFYVPLICDKLGLVLDDLEDEPLAPISNIDEDESSEECEVQTSLDSEEHMEISRRDAAFGALKAAGFAFIPGTSILSTPVQSPDEYLAQCEDAIDSCWTFMNQGNQGKVERSLNLHVPRLTQYANTESEHQREAAGLSVQAMILQMILATYRFDYAGRKRLGADAVRFGRISGNPIALATALDWHGNTHIYCYSQPQKAIALFDEALKALGSNALLNRSSLYSQLSIAYALIKDQVNAKENEKLALDYAKLARDTMPTYPELDPLYPCIRFGPSELDQFEARMYRLLADRFPKANYGKLAYSLFDSSLKKQAISEAQRGKTLVRRADAARVLGNMNGFVKDLTDGLDISIRTKHIGIITEADDVMSDILPEWQRETSVISLQKEISQALVVRHR